MKINSVEARNLDGVIQEKVDRLNQLKIEAVENEDFDQAKFYKYLIDRLLVIGNQMHQLQQEKEAAIENEDYDLAKRIKNKMDELRDQTYKM